MKKFESKKSENILYDINQLYQKALLNNYMEKNAINSLHY